MKNQSLCLAKIYLISKNNKEDNVDIYENINLNLLESLDIYNFFEWFDKLVHENWKYISEKIFIGFRLIFLNNEKFINNEIYPVLLTTDNNLKYIFEDQKNKKKKNIKYLNKKIKILEKKIKYSLFNRKNK